MIRTPRAKRPRRTESADGCVASPSNSTESTTPRRRDGVSTEYPCHVVSMGETLRAADSESLRTSFGNLVQVFAVPRVFLSVR